MKMWMRPWTARNGFSERYFKMAGVNFPDSALDNQADAAQFG